MPSAVDKLNVTLQLVDDIKLSLLRLTTMPIEFIESIGTITFDTKL